MPVTLQSVFNACASDTTKPADAVPVVVFLGGAMKRDSSNDKLVIVYFRPYKPAVTSFEDVELHIHVDPYEWHTGINIRAKSSGSGVVGSGIGTMAHGGSVDKTDSKYPFYDKLKRAATAYMNAQLLIHATKKHVLLPQEQKVFTKRENDVKRATYVWGLPQFWDKATAFTTQSVVLSPGAVAAKQKKETEGSVASAQVTAQLDQKMEVDPPVAPAPVVGGVLVKK
ncbi:unnamed protein product [Gemmata massiliana]|uniref:Uncharacterized protein n=1 Tax=Gemmata massiliana TaxID=1210884 RepID=A0A6P2CY56_9BACT|nr:hypothetical protein [Gemmata massiliana]VTR93316.1 unnamed protein product [Gemmata massiliana]